MHIPQLYIVEFIFQKKKKNWAWLLLAWIHIPQSYIAEFIFQKETGLGFYWLGFNLFLLITKHITKYILII